MSRQAKPLGGTARASMNHRSGGVLRSRDMQPPPTLSRQRRGRLHLGKRCLVSMLVQRRRGNPAVPRIGPPALGREVTTCHDETESANGRQRLESAQ